MLYEILKTSKLGASFAPDMYTALWAQKLARDGEVKTLSGAPPLSFKANGTPLLDYLISGNTVQSGTPTPDNPVMPQGTGERTGNLFDISTVEKGRIDNGVVGYVSQTSSLTIDGGTVAFTTTATYRGVCSGFFELPEGTETITFNFICNEALGVKFVFYDSTKTWLNQDYTPTLSDIPPATANVPSGAKYVRISFTGQIVGGYSYTMSNLMLNLGSTALPFEPFGVKIPISSANTTTPVYLGEVQTTRKIRKLVLTGQESWDVNPATNVFFVAINNALGTANAITSVCSHYQAVGNKTLYINVDNYCSCIRANASVLWIKDTNYGSSSYYAALEGFKSYLASQYANGTPVTVWYVLAEPETAVVNEPLMKIGDYADTVSMEQAGVEIPTTRGTNTLDVLTDVKPSNVYLKYKEV